MTGGPTVTVTLACGLVAPPGPTQSSEYVDVTVGVTTTVPPPTGCAPLQDASPTLDAVQLVAFVLLHVRSAEPPSAIVVGLAEMNACTAGPTVTVTVAGGLVAPPAPVQTKVYVEVTVGVTVKVPPAGGRGPVQLASSALEPLQLVAFVLDHVRSLEPPSAIVSGAAASEAVTGAPTVTVALAGALVAPPAPVQMTEYAVVTVGETETLPLGSPPVLKPVPTHADASVLPQVSVLVPPGAIVGGAAASVAVGAGPTTTVAAAAG